MESSGVDVEAERSLDIDVTYQRALGRATAKLDQEAEQRVIASYLEQDREDYLRLLPHTD